MLAPGQLLVQKVPSSSVRVEGRGATTTSAFFTLSGLKDQRTEFEFERVEKYRKCH